MASVCETSMTGSGLPEDTNAAPGDCHRHGEYEIIMAVSGTVTASIGETFHRLEPHGLLFIPAWVEHCCVAGSEDAGWGTVIFSPAQLPQSLRDRCASLGAAPASSRDWPAHTAASVRQAIRQIFKEQEEQGPGYEIAIDILIQQALLTMLRELPDLPESSGACLSDGFERVLGYLDQHYEDHISLRDCAAAMGYSENYISRLFKKKAGICFHTYLQALRLSKAEWLLANTADSITEVAMASGFGNIKTFNRIFRNRWTMPPGQFRHSMSAAPMTGRGRADGYEPADHSTQDYDRRQYSNEGRNSALFGEELHADRSLGHH